MIFAQPNSEFQIFQFPPNQIPRIDGEFSDWEMVPDSYSIGLDKLMDTRFGRGTNLDPKDYDIDVKVGWVNGFSRLYFYVQAWDDYWDFDEISPESRLASMIKLTKAMDGMIVFVPARVDDSNP